MRVSKSQTISCCVDIHLRLSQSKCDHFAAEFSDNPSRAFDNCDSIMEAAAELAIWKDVKASFADAAIKGETELDRAAFLVEFFGNKMSNMAMYPHRSTSTTSNYMHVCELSAVAELVVEMKQLIAQESPKSAEGE